MLHDQIILSAVPRLSLLIASTGINCKSLKDTATLVIYVRVMIETFMNTMITSHGKYPTYFLLLFK